MLRYTAISGCGPITDSWTGPCWIIWTRQSGPGYRPRRCCVTGLAGMEKSGLEKGVERGGIKLMESTMEGISLMRDMCAGGTVLHSST